MKRYSYWLDTVSDVEPWNAGFSTTPNTQHPASGTPRAEPAAVNTETVAVGRGRPEREIAVPSRADVVIVGGGYTGLSAARHLARVGAVVVVVERERIGFGASSRNGGQVLTGLKLDPGTLVARYGDARARALFDISLESIAIVERMVAEDGIDCDLERTGHIQAASKPSHFSALEREQDLLARVFHHQVRLVPPSEQQSELGSERSFGLLIDERSAAINPAKYVQGLALAAHRAGATLCDRTRLARLVRAGSKWTVVTDRGDIDARDVLIATNGYTNGAVPFLQRRLIPIGSYVIATSPLEADLAARLIPKRRMVFTSKHFLYYFRMTRDRRLLFGGRAEFSKPTEASTLRATATLQKGMTSLFPALEHVPIEYAWNGNVAFTRDQMPRAGCINNAYYAGGYCGHGVAMATYLGSLIARRIAGEPIVHPLFDDDFAAIPFYTGTPWFLPLVGAYYRYRDFVD